MTTGPAVTKKALRNIDDPLNKVYESKEYKETSRNLTLEFHLILDVEISGKCNLTCMMCARSLKNEREMENMKPELFYRIADEATACGAKLIRFSGYGEALLHKDFTKFIGYAKKKGLLTHLTTNGLLLTENISRQIIEIPLTKIKFSFQGTDKDEFNRIRNTKDYDKLRDNIIMLRRIRESSKKKLPMIQVATTVLSETQEQINEFYNQWESIADTVYHLPTLLWRLEDTDFGKKNKNFARGKLLDSSCIEIRTKMSIWNDGKVSGCCNDYFHRLLLGDMKDKNLKEIWNDEPARNIRNLLNQTSPAFFSEEDKQKYPLCAECQTTAWIFEKE